MGINDLSDLRAELAKAQADIRRLSTARNELSKAYDVAWGAGIGTHLSIADVIQTLLEKQVCLTAERDDLRRQPCIDCLGTGKCPCPDPECGRESCIVCGGTGRTAMVTRDDVATEMQRLQAKREQAAAERDEARADLARMQPQPSPIPSIRVDPPVLPQGLADSVADGFASVAERELAAERDRYLTRAVVAEAKLAKVREVAQSLATGHASAANSVLGAILTAIGGKS